MKRSFAGRVGRSLVLFSLSSGVVLARAQMPAAPLASEVNAIQQTALDFEEGWYEGDADRMARALHPQFVMRHVGIENTGKSVLDQDITAPELIAFTRAGRGKVAPERRRHDITVLDVYQNAATAKIIAWYGVDYLQLAKWNGQWLILSVVWGKNPPPQ
jgi:Putative lumazine-binding